MRRGIPVRRSRAAGWARLCGGLALPVLVLGALGTRAGMVPQVALQPVLIAGFALGILAAGLSAYSLADIWKSGAAGARTAIIGMVYAAPVLVILGLVAAAAIAYPRLTDVSTNVDDPPLFSQAGATHGVLDARSAAIQREAYPDIVSHTYPLPLGEVYLAARHVVDARRWRVIRDVHPDLLPGGGPGAATSQALAEDDELIKALAQKSVMTQSRSGMATETRPGAAGNARQDAAPSAPREETGPGNEATLEVLAPTPVFGFLDDVVVRLKSTPEGTAVDMRSASRVGEHDLGQNARRIASFFAQLDSVLQPDPGTVSVAR